MPVIITQITTINGSRSLDKKIAGSNTMPRRMFTPHFANNQLRVFAHDDEGRMFRVNVPVEDLIKAVGRTEASLLLQKYDPDDAARLHKEVQEYLEYIATRR